jgi:hypothetical protein
VCFSGIVTIRREMNNKNYPNLKPWKRGQSGNPAGRKPGSQNVSTIVRNLLEQDTQNDLLEASFCVSPRAPVPAIAGFILQE